MNLPRPPVPTKTNLADFPFTPMYRARLFGSTFHARANDSEWRAGVTLWLKAQDQVPAGSLPKDDIELCRLAELGRDLKAWKKVKVRALHGWYECDDGRLYNNVVSEVVMEQWKGKLAQRSRTLKARIAALEKRLSEATNEAAKLEILSQLQSLRQEMLQDKKLSVTEAVIDDVTEPVTRSVTETKREGKGEGQGYLEESYPGSEDLSGLAQEADPFPTGLDRPALGPVAMAALATIQGGKR
jgi:hypothetical protein